jgi:flagellar motor switch protein FliN/FliY
MEPRRIDLSVHENVHVTKPIGKISGLKDVHLDLSVVIGHAVLTLDQLTKLGRGAIIELDRIVGQHVDVLVNGTPIAKGEIVVVEDRIAVTLLEVLRDN